jgi:UDP-N-acetylglucosamine 2-epimerase (non-hydrolysing)
MIMNFLSIIGTRPQYIKYAAIQRAFKLVGIEHDYIDSGQHYDIELSANVARDLGIPRALSILAPGNGEPLEQISNLLVQISEQLDRYKPKMVLVYGDTNTTLAAAIACVKKGIKFAHIEAGLRSRNRENQEERNRILVDHVADLLLAPTKNAVQNLIDEGLGGRTKLVGDVMVDVLRQGAPYILPRNFSYHSIKEFDFYVGTFHRAENVDSKETLTQIIRALSEVDRKIVLFAHPRLEKNMQLFGLEFPKNTLKLPPVSHSEILSWIKFSNGLITDSGGLQKEAFILRVPCTTLRHETEWVETLADGWNVLVQRPSDLAKLVKRIPTPTESNPFGDGQAGSNIVSLLQETLNN